MAGIQIEFTSRLKILVKPSSSKTEILSFDDSRKAWRVNVAAPPEDNKANIAIIKFFTKLSKKNVRIVSGLTSKVKVLEFS